MPDNPFDAVSLPSSKAIAEAVSKLKVLDQDELEATLKQVDHDIDNCTEVLAARGLEAVKGLLVGLIGAI